MEGGRDRGGRREREKGVDREREERKKGGGGRGGRREKGEREREERKKGGRGREKRGKEKGKEMLVVDWCCERSITSTFRHGYHWSPVAWTLLFQQ